MTSKSKKNKTKKVPFLALTTLASALLKLNTLCVADIRVVSTLLTDIEALINRELDQLAKSFKAAHKLGETEEVAENHPLFSDWATEQAKLEVDLEVTFLNRFGEDQLNKFMEGKEFSFNEKRALVEFTIQ